MRRLVAEIGGAARADLLGRDRPEQARREGRLRRGEAGRLRRAHARAGVRALRRRAARARAGDRPEDRRAAGRAMGLTTLGARRRGAASSCSSSASGRTSAASCAGARASSTTASVGARAQGRLGVARADVRHRHRATPRELREALARDGASSCARASQRHGRSGRTIGIKVRLDDFTTVTRAHTLPRADARRRARRRAWRCGCSREYAPPRPVRLLGVRVAGLHRDGDDAGDGRAAAARRARRATRTAPPLDQLALPV